MEGQQQKQQPCSAAYIRLVDPRSDGCAWDEYGRRIVAPIAMLIDAETDAPTEEPNESHYRYAYGLPPTTTMLTADELGVQCGFDFVTGLIVTQSMTRRELPLHLLPRNAVPQLENTDTDLLHRVHAAVRTGFVHASLMVGVVSTTENYVAHGLFASDSIPNRAVVGEYVGLLVEDATLPPCAAEDDDYLMAYPAVGYHISGRHFGGITRFINHACSADACVEVVPVLVDGAYHMVVITLKEVERGTQLCFDYGESYWKVKGRSAPTALEDAF